MSEIKIHQGTGRLTGKPLCFSCTHAIIREDEISCRAGYGEEERIKKPIFNCTAYYNKCLPSLPTMMEIAWELKFDGRKVGFKPPDKRDGPPPIL